MVSRPAGTSFVALTARRRKGSPRSTTVPSGGTPFTRSSMPPTKKSIRPPQHQKRQPGRESAMRPRPRVVLPDYRGSGKLAGKASLITGGDSGIGRAVAVLFAKEGADVAITYLDEKQDAAETQRMVEAQGRRCL